MSPLPSIYDQQNDAFLNPVLTRKTARGVFTGNIFSSDFQHLRVGKFYGRVPFTSISPIQATLWSNAFARCVSALLYAIDHICNVRSREQVRRITAWRVVAAVKHPKIPWVNTRAQIIGDPMCSEWLCLLLWLPNTVSVFITSGSPFPTFIWPSPGNLRLEARDLLRRKLWEYTIRFSHAVHSLIVNSLVRLTSGLTAWRGPFCLKLIIT